VKQASTSAMIELLVPIWQRLLQRTSIGIDDNFFDLGGDSALALELFNEIERLCNRELPPVVIYHASTIATLAALLEDPETPRFPPLVLLRQCEESFDGPSLFITHGLGGSVMDFYQVIKHVQTPQTIYGMQARGLDGVDAPFDRIEDMADFYLEAVRSSQPHGPYFLVGYSLGGLVTMEMAQRLSAMGEKVALLAMLDSYPHPRYLSFEQRLRLKTRLTARRAALLTKLPLRESVSRAFKPSRHKIATHGSTFQLPNDVAMTPTMQHVRNCAYLALQRYQPRLYSGRVRFVRAGILTDFPANIAAVWKNLVKEMTVDTIASDHLGIMTTRYDELGRTITRYLHESLS